MKKLIYVFCILISVSSCVSKNKFTIAENGRLAALSRERALHKNLTQQKEENTGLKKKIEALEGDTARLGKLCGTIVVRCIPICQNRKN